MEPRARWRPRTRRGWLLTSAGVTAVLVAGVVALLFLVVLGTSSPPPLRLGGSSSTGGQSGPAASGSQPTEVAGTWTVGGGSVAGYRVREKLAFLPAPSDAVGRTQSVQGTATLGGSGSGASVTAASFKVDVSSLSSDREMRDSRIHSIGLESDRYPDATFELTSPISLPASATNGAAFHVDAAGRLTIHGTTRTETIPLDARLSGSEIEVVGSITFPWSDFGMEAPSIGGFVSVTDQATMEFDLHLHRG